jgi:hypothetical protein
MADSVISTKLKDHASAWAYAFTNESDGTGETNIRKVNANTLIASTGDGSTQRLTVNKIAWTIAGANSKVKLMWGGTGSNTFAYLTGTGTFDLATNLTTPFVNTTANTTGDIYLSTLGFTTGATYTLVIEGKKTAGYSSRETTDDGISP